MTRKDFDLIARVLRYSPERDSGDGEYTRGYLQACEDLSRDFADRLNATNERFDRARFLEACGVR